MKNCWIIGDTGTITIFAKHLQNKETVGEIIVKDIANYDLLAI